MYDHDIAIVRTNVIIITRNPIILTHNFSTNPMQTGLKCICIFGIILLLIFFNLKLYMKCQQFHFLVLWMFYSEGHRTCSHFVSAIICLAFALVWKYLHFRIFHASFSESPFDFQTQFQHSVCVSI